MRRRIVVALVMTVVGALVVAGAGTLLLTSVSERRSATADLRAESASIARAADTLVQPRVFAVFVEVLRLSDAAVVYYDGSGQMIGPTAVPNGVAVDQIDIAALSRGAIVAGDRGRTVFAAAPLELDRLRNAVATLPTANATPGSGDPGPALGRRARARARPLVVPPEAAGAAVVITRRLSPGPGVAGGYFLLAAGLALAVAVVVADRLSRRLSRPLLASEAATRRIARGDLAARVPVEPGEVPELVSLAGSVNAMAEELAAAKNLERQFLLSVSHELRTPLTSIRGYAEAIADGAAANHTHAADVIGSEARRLERLVGDLLLLAKLDARSFSLTPVSVDLTEIAREAAEGFRPKANELGLALETPAPASQPVPGATVLADPDRLGQVTANLVENALKYARSCVTVSVQPAPAGKPGWPAADAGAGGWVLVVTDDGSGIAVEDLPHVFERLYQSPSRVSNRQLGSGLGLAIVAELVAAMAGTVHAEPSPAGGTRMIVRLQAAP